MDLHSFPDHLLQLFKMLETNRERLESDMMSPLASSGGGYNEKHSKETRALAEASKALGQEARAWIDGQSKAVKALGQSKKLDLLIQFLQSLPVAMRWDAYDKMMGLERKRVDGIKINVPARKKGNQGGSKAARTRGRPGDSADLEHDVQEE